MSDHDLDTIGRSAFPGGLDLVRGGPVCSQPLIAPW
jgi:hypothetical protein